MRTSIILLVCLLAACGADEENNAANVDVNADNVGAAGPAPADVPIQNDETADPPATQPSPETPATPPGAPAPPPPVNESEERQPAGRVTLGAAPARTRAGRTMTLTLTNGTNGPLGYNLCTSAILRQSGTQVRTGRICTMELRTLRPGRSATYAYELPENLAAGTYRFLTQVERMGSGRRQGVRSNNFNVR